MTEEITRIKYDGSGRRGMKIDRVLNIFQNRKTQNQTTPIDLTLHCSFIRPGSIYHDVEFSETAEIRSKFLDNIVHIIHFAIYDIRRQGDKNVSWFNYLLQFLQTNHGGTKYAVQYHVNYLSLEYAIKLSDAIRLNNYGHIQSFTLCAKFINTEVFQTIWNTLLETGVPQVNIETDTDTNAINFTGLSTNMSLKRLDFKGLLISQHNWRNLFISIGSNKGLEKLKICISSHSDLEMLPCFTKMLRKNTTLIVVEASNIHDNDVHNGFNNVIIVETKSNRKWKQYQMKREEDEEEEKKQIASAITKPPPPLPAHLAAAAERKRRYKNICLLYAFENKRVMRDTILFHFLSETPILLIDNEVQHNVNQIYRNKKKKRPRQQQQCERY